MHALHPTPEYVDILNYPRAPKQCVPELRLNHFRVHHTMTSVPPVFYSLRWISEYRKEVSLREFHHTLPRDITPPAYFL